MGPQRFATQTDIILGLAINWYVMLKCKGTIWRKFCHSFWLDACGTVSSGFTSNAFAMLWINDATIDPIWILSINTLWLSGFARKKLCMLLPMGHEFAKVTSHSYWCNTNNIFLNANVYHFDGINEFYWIFYCKLVLCALRNVFCSLGISCISKNANKIVWTLNKWKTVIDDDNTVH